MVQAFIYLFVVFDLGLFLTVFALGLRTLWNLGTERNSADHVSCQGTGAVERWIWMYCRGDRKRGETRSQCCLQYLYKQKKTLRVICTQGLLTC